MEYLEKIAKVFIIAIGGIGASAVVIFILMGIGFSIWDSIKHLRSKKK
jgi:hypothetical protein